MFSRLKNFFVESRSELKQVQWPTRREAVYLSLVVIGLSLFLAAYLGGFDYLYTFLLQKFVAAY